MTGLELPPGPPPGQQQQPGGPIQPPPDHWQALGYEAKVKLLNQKLLELDAAMRFRMEQLGMAQQGLEQQALQMSMEDKQNQLLAIEGAAEWGDYRAPGTAQQYLGDVQKLEKGISPELMPLVERVRRGIGERADFGQKMGQDEEIIRRYARDLHKNETEQNVGQEMVQAAVKGSYLGHFGAANERVLGGISEAVDRAVQTRRERWRAPERFLGEEKDWPKGFPSDEDYRARLIAVADQEIKDSGGVPEESDTRGVLREAAHFASMLFPAGVASRLFGGAGAGVVRAAGGTVKSAITAGKVMGTIGAGAAFAAAAGIQGAPTAVKAQLDRGKPNGEHYTEEERGQIESASTKLSMATAAVLAPVLHMAPVVGRYLTGGAGGAAPGAAMQWLRTSVGFPVAAEAGQGMVDLARKGVEESVTSEESKAAWKKLAAVMPHAPGAAEQVLRAGYHYATGGKTEQLGQELVGAVQSYVREFLPGALAFGTTQVLSQMGMQSLLTPTMRKAARADVDRILDPAEASAAEAVGMLGGAEPVDTEGAARAEAEAVVGKDKLEQTTGRAIAEERAQEAMKAELAAPEKTRGPKRFEEEHEATVAEVEAKRAEVEAMPTDSPERRAAEEDLRKLEDHSMRVRALAEVAAEDPKRELEVPVRPDLSTERAPEAEHPGVTAERRIPSQEERAKGNDKLIDDLVEGLRVKPESSPAPKEEAKPNADAEAARRDSDAALLEATGLYERAQKVTNPRKRAMLEARALALAGHAAALRLAGRAALEGRQVSWPRRPGAEEVATRLAKLRETRRAQAATDPEVVARAAEKARRRAVTPEAYTERQRQRFAHDTEEFGLATAGRMHLTPGDRVRIGGEVFHVERVSGNRLGLRSESGVRSRVKWDRLERRGGVELVDSNLGRRQQVNRAIARRDMEAAVQGLRQGDVVGTDEGQATVVSRSEDGVRVRLPDGSFKDLTASAGPRLRGQVQPRSAPETTTEERTVSILQEAKDLPAQEGAAHVEAVVEAAQKADEAAAPEVKEASVEGTAKIEPPQEPTPSVTPQPASSLTPADAVKAVDSLRRNGILKDLVDGVVDADKALEQRETKARGEAKEFSAWLRGQAWFHDAMRSKKANRREVVADAVWRWLAKKAGSTAPVYSVQGLSQRLLRELDAVLKIQDPGARLKAMMDWQKFNEGVLSTPQAVALRFSPYGVRFLGRYETAKRALFNGQCQAFSGLPIPYLLQAVYPLLNLPSYALRYGGLSLTPAGALKYVQDAVRHLEADPQLNAEGLRNRLFGGAFEGPWWSGRVAQDAVRTVSRISNRVAQLYRAVLGPKGLLRRAGITQGSQASTDVFHALDKGPASAEWLRLTPEQRHVAGKLRQFHKTIARLLARHHPFVLRLETEVALVGKKYQRARAASARASQAAQDAIASGASAATVQRLANRATAVEARAQKLRDWMDDSLSKRREFMAEWGIADYVRYVREAQMRGPGDYHPVGDRAFDKLRRPARSSVERRREQDAAAQAEIEAEHPLIRDVVVAMSDYLPHAIGAIEKQAFFRRHAEFLYGKPRLATVTDLMSPNPEAWYVDSVKTDAAARSFRGRGFFYHDPITGTLTRAELPPAGQGGIPDSRNALGHRLVVAFLDHAAGRLPERPSYRVSTDQLERLGASELKRAIEGQAIRLLSPYEALGYVVHEGGWFTRASRTRQGDMTAFLEEFAYGIRAQETRMFDAKSYARNAWLAHLERGVKRTFRALSSPIIGMWNYKTALTALAGGTFHNQNLLPPQYLAEAGVEAMRFLGRRARIRADLSLGLDVLSGTADKPDLRLRNEVEAMKTNPSDLVGMTPEQMKRRQLWDEGFEDLYGSGLFEGKMADAHDASLNVKALKTGQQAAWWQKLGRGVGHAVNRIDHAGYALLSGTEAMVRSHGWLGVYMMARDQGQSRTEARKLAELSMLMQHGIFNHVASSAFFKSWMGPGFGGIMAWSSHWFGQFTRAPMRYKLQFMGQSVAAWYLLQQMGGGDYTNVFGGSMYDVVAINRLAEQFGVGVVSPLAKKVPVVGDLLGSMADHGYVPFPFPSGSSPLLGLLDGAQEAADLLLKGRVDDSARVFRDTALRSLTPRVAEEVNTFFASEKAAKAKGFENEPDVWRGIPLASRLFGLKSPGVPIETHGLVGLILSALPGLEPWRAEQIVDMRRRRVEQEAAKGASAQRRDEARSIFRRMEEVRQAPEMPGAQEESKDLRVQFSDLARRSAAEGQFLHTPGEMAEIQREARGDLLPSPLRQITREPNKEIAARHIAGVFEAINEGRYRFASQDLIDLLSQVAGKQGISKWAMDPKITPATGNRLSAAVETWMASRRSTSATPTPR